jgi:hypothetical protein
MQRISPHRRIGVVLVLASGYATALLLPRSGVASNLGMYFPGIAHATPSCGACHAPSPGAAPGFAPIAVQLAPARRALAAGQSIAIALAVSGGQSASTRGGFALEATAGAFSAGVDTNVVAPGNIITHFNSPTRSWRFGYTAPTAPGFVELRCVVNTVNDNAVNDDGDMWAFHGADDTAVQVTPVRLFVQAAGVTALGEACAGAFGNVPVLGCRRSPILGDAAFAVELHGAAPAAPTGLLLGAAVFPGGLDLSGFGGPGCRLHVDAAIVLSATTGAGNAQRGEGAVNFALPIPADPSLAGAVLHAQAFVADAAHGRPLPLTFTNGVSITLR